MVAFTTLTSNIYDLAITLNQACNPFISTILFGLLEYSKITLFKDLVRKIIEDKVA